MVTIPEIASQLVDEFLAETHDDNNVSTIFLVGDKYAGKSTLLNIFLDKVDNPRETFVLEYSFGRKSNQKEGFEKSLCHIWDYGGKLEMLKNILPAIPLQGKCYFCVMIDLSKIKDIWDTIETSVQTMIDVYSGTKTKPELILICGKYDIFKNYENDLKKFICTTIRSVALLHEAHVMFYSSKDPQLVKRTKDLLQSMGFGHNVLFKEKNTHATKPLAIPKGTDSWENIGVSATTLEQVKIRHQSRIPPSTNSAVLSSGSMTQKKSHPEQAIDSLAAMKYSELRSMELFHIDDYLMSMN